MLPHRKPPRGILRFLPLLREFTHTLSLKIAWSHLWVSVQQSPAHGFSLDLFTSYFSKGIYNSLYFQSFRNSSKWQAHYRIYFLLSSFRTDLNSHEVHFLSFLMMLCGRKEDMFSVCFLEPISTLFSKETLVSN